MQVHIFGEASSPCIANSTLRRVADDNAEEYSSSVITAVKRNFYVDDALPSENDEQCAIRLAHDMVELLARGGFNLTKFTSNSKRLLSAVPNDKRSKPDLNLDLDELYSPLFVYCLILWVSQHQWLCLHDAWFKTYGRLT